MQKPTESQLRRTKQTVLNQINRYRAMRGWQPLNKLRCGDRNEATHCPIRNSMGRNCVAVDEGVVMMSGEGLAELVSASLGTPKVKGDFNVIDARPTPAMTRFIGWFDSGFYPELERRG